MRFVLRMLSIAVCLLASATFVHAQFFFDDFDSYTAGTNIAGQGGWETWANDPTANAQVVSTFANSPPNSLADSGAADIVHQFAGITSGTWYAKVQTYIPSSQLGDLYFIILNRYDGACANTGDCDWSVQVRMNAADGEVVSEGGSGNPSTASPLTLLTDQWVELLVEINLDSNQYSVFYNGTLLDTLPWSVSGDINVAAFDLFSSGSSESYMDDVWLDTTIPVELQSFSVE